MSPSDWIATKPKRTQGAGTNRITLEVGAHSFFLESEHPLTAAPEIAASAFYLPARSAGVRIEFESPLDREFLANLDRVGKLADSWWGWPAAVETVVAKKSESSASPRAGTGLFFTAGVDSFCTLRRNLGQIDSLISVHGFDVALRDGRRFAEVERRLSRIANGLDLDLICIKTDLRHHPLFRSLGWPLTHGAALAAVAHSLRNRFGRILIASSDVLPPWGSHPDLDVLWSSSDLEIVNDASELTRLEKVRSIADWELVGETLKVCWENRSAELNCGACEKCVRTQVQFATTQERAKLSAFPGGELLDKIDGLPFVEEELHKQWIEIRQSTRDPAVQAAIERVLARRKKVRLRDRLRRSWRMLRR